MHGKKMLHIANASMRNSPLNGTMNLKLLHTFFSCCSQGSDQGDKSNRCVCAFTHTYVFVCCNMHALRCLSTQHM